MNDHEGTTKSCEQRTSLSMRSGFGAVNSTLISDDLENLSEEARRVLRDIMRCQPTAASRADSILYEVRHAGRVYQIDEADIPEDVLDRLDIVIGDRRATGS